MSKIDKTLLIYNDVVGMFAKNTRSNTVFKKNAIGRETYILLMFNIFYIKAEFFLQMYDFRNETYMQRYRRFSLELFFKRIDCIGFGH